MQLIMCVHILKDIHIGIGNPKFYEYKYHTFQDMDQPNKDTDEYFKQCTSHNCVHKMFNKRKNNLQ